MLVHFGADVLVLVHFGVDVLCSFILTSTFRKVFFGASDVNFIAGLLDAYYIGIGLFGSGVGTYVGCNF